MRKLLLLSLSILCTIAVHAQSRYLWTGAVNNNWKNAGNWTLVGGSPISYGYPTGITAIALFGTSAYAPPGPNVNCTIDGNYLPTGALYVGGIEVNDYTGIITQGVNNRFVISDCPGMNGCAYTSTYKAVFNFGPGGEFRGSTTVNVAGSLNYQDNYTIGVGVEMFITGGLFYAPRKMLMENHLTITTGCFVGAGFDGSGGVVSFYPRPGSISFPTYFINAGSSSFHDLQIYTGKTCDLNGGNVTVANNLITAGAGGYLKISNGQLHIKRDIIINSTDYSTYSLGVAHNPGGTAMLYLDGTVQQNIIKNVTGATETSGPLGNLTIDNNNGVIISERVNIAGSLTFVNGIISPQTSGSPNDVLVFDNAAVVYGASDASYCEAPVRKHMYSLPAVSFEFPVGKSGEYHPAIISSPTGGSGGYGSTNPANYTQFTIDYFDTPTPDAMSWGAGTNAVHDCQYWSIERNNKPTSNAKVGLTWNNSTCQSPAYFTPSSDMCVAQYDGNDWLNRGVFGGVGGYSILGGSKIQEANGAPVTQFLTGSATYFTFCHANPYSPPPPLTLTTTWTQPTCNPGTDGTATVNVAGAMGTITYAWSPSGQTTSTATGLAMGTYTVTVTTSFGQSGTAIVNINTSLISGVTLASTPTICETSLPVLLTLGTPAGGTYSGSPYISLGSGTDYYFDPQLSGVGLWPYTYTDGYGCGYSASGNVNVVPGPERPLGWEWANGPTTTSVSRGNDVAYDNVWDRVYTVGNFSGTVDFGGGALTSAGGEDVFLLCHNASTGALLWAKNYGGSGDDFGYGVTFTGSTIGIVGHFTATTNFDGFVATSNGGTDGYLAGLDMGGNVMYLNSIGGINFDKVTAISNDGSNYYIAGHNDFTSPTISFGSGITLTDVGIQSFVAKYTVPSGTCSWAINGSGDYQQANAVDVNSNGNITVGGFRYGSAQGWLESYTASGTFLKFNYFEAAAGFVDYDPILGGISHDASGNIYITGIYSAPAGTSSAKFNSSSLTVSTFVPITSGTTINGLQNEIYYAIYDANLMLTDVDNVGANSGYILGTDIKVDAVGNQYITGTFNGTISNLCYSISSFGYDDIFIVKLDNLGNFQWAQKPDGNYYEVHPSIDLDATGNIYMCGSIAGGIVNFGTIPVNSGATNTFTAKLGPTGSSVYRASGESATKISSQENLEVFPNPNNGEFTINTNSDAPKDVVVYDMNGRIVFTLVQTTENTIAVDISNEAKGLYVVKVSDGTNVQTARVSNQ